MSERAYLTEDMKRLMGISRSQNGGLPVMFAPAGEVVEGAKAPKARPFHALKSTPQPLEERRALTMFKDESAMQDALDRAHKLIARVNATVQHDRQNSVRSSMQEKTRAEMYRLDQELATSLDAINAAHEALGSLKQAKKEAKRERREQRRQGR